jgi:flagellar biogenesis protein FliO
VSRLALRAFAAAAGLAAALGSPAVALGQSAEGVGTGVSGFDTGDWFGLLLRLGLVLAVIWGAVLGMRWYVRRMTGQSSGRADGRALQILETRTLAPNRSLALVRLGGRAVLIGITPERITSLLSVDDPDEVEGLATPPEGASRRPLGAVLSGLASVTAPSRGAPARASAEAGTARARLGWRELLRRARGRRPAALAAPPPQRSLFERTLAASRGPVPSGEPAGARALRARAGYGRAAAAGQASERREAQIGEIQRAIASMRRNAG